MATILVSCPLCGQHQVVKRGKTQEGKQRFLCVNAECEKKTFILDYSYNGALPEVKSLIVEMALNGGGIRDTARVLGVSPTTVIQELKKRESSLESVNWQFLERTEPNKINVIIQRAVKAELDEMWSFVRVKENQRWLWHAIDHDTGAILAYVFGKRTDAVFLKLKELLEPFGVTQFFTDDWGAYDRHLPPDRHTVGKRNTQKIERKHLTLRTRIKRLARKTICFSKLERMHDIVIGLFINRYEFGIAV
jgi:insertion element IS1 protein InsB